MKKTLFALASLLFALSARAGSEGINQSIGFDDMKMACQNPSRFHNQTAPTSIQVSCHDVQYRWVPEDSSAWNLESSRRITTSVMSDKYMVAPATEVVATAPQAVACPNYKQISEVVDTVRAVSCDELIAFSGTGAQFCSQAIDATRSINPQAIMVSDTGQKLSLCASRGGGGRGQH